MICFEAAFFCSPKCQQLFWNATTKRIYSNVDTRIVDGVDNFIGEGFCNIENASYTPTNCAERTAVFKAVSEGILDFEAIAIAGGPGLEPPRDFAPPCGVCRQVLVEFCDPDRFLVLLCKGDKTWKEFTLAELLPLGFSGRAGGGDQSERV